MRLGMIGLGKMGGNMSRRLLAGGHRVVVYDRDPEAVRELAEGRGPDGLHPPAIAAASVAELVEELTEPRVVWLMVPAGEVVDAVLAEVVPLLAAGDVVVDGGNSYYKQTLERAARWAEHGVHLVDCGTSGGVWGLTEGYSLMVGGREEAVEVLRPVLESLAPAVDRGWGHVGPPGAGHYVKMVHNGIEYGLMQAYAEGFALLHHKEEMALDLGQVAEIWRHGSVVRSWLLDLLAGVFGEDQGLAGVAPWVADSGEGRWTVLESVELASPAPVIALALMQRFRSRDEESYPDRVLAALRNAFGGHAMKTLRGGDDASSSGEAGARPGSAPSTPPPAETGSARGKRGGGPQRSGGAGRGKAARGTDGDA